jgi:hypothetical protein
MSEPPERSKPSRWWESTRTERDVQRVEPAHRREVATPTGSRRSRELTGCRGNAGETQERRIRRLIQVEYRRAEGDAKLMEDALGVVSCKHQRAGQAQEHPEDQRGNM